MAYTKRLYDENTGLYHVSTTESGTGIGSLDSKSVSVNVAGNNDQTTDYPSNLHVSKLIKADFRAHIEGIRGVFQVGVIDSAYNTTSTDDPSTFDVYDGFSIDHGCFFSEKSDWSYRKVWKPNKYAQSSDKDLFIALDPQGFLNVLDTYGYAMSIYTIWKIL